MSFVTTATTVVVILVFSAEIPLHAYIDPGSTSLFLQALVGGIAAVIVTTRGWWLKALDRLRRPQPPQVQDR